MIGPIQTGPELSELVARANTHSEECLPWVGFSFVLVKSAFFDNERTDTMIRRMARFRTALIMAARRILTSSHFMIFPIARARAAATFLAWRPRSHLQCSAIIIHPQVTHLVGKRLHLISN